MGAISVAVYEDGSIRIKMTLVTPTKELILTLSPTLTEYNNVQVPHYYLYPTQGKSMKNI